LVPAQTRGPTPLERIEVSMDIEQLIYEAGRLHEATSLLGRMRRNLDQVAKPSTTI
jgi:hypothetical protein